MTRFEVGQAVVLREVLHGEVWLELPETVVADDGVVLATVLRPGAPLTHRPDHPFGVHPWAHVTAWQGSTVLKLRRTGDWYSVWKFFDGDRFRHWYVNFEEPSRRTTDGLEANDLELDLVVDPDGTRSWKDVEHLHARLGEGRFGLDDLRHVLEAAAAVSDLLDRDDRWWAPWDDWVPGES